MVGADTENFICPNCGESNDKLYHCVPCNEVLCNACLDYHNPPINELSCSHCGNLMNTDYECIMKYPTCLKCEDCICGDCSLGHYHVSASELVVHGGLQDLSAVGGLEYEVVRAARDKHTEGVGEVVG